MHSAYLKNINALSIPGYNRGAWISTGYGWSGVKPTDCSTAFGFVLHRSKFNDDVVVELKIVDRSGNFIAEFDPYWLRDFLCSIPENAPSNLFIERLRFPLDKNSDMFVIRDGRLLIRGCTRRPGIRPNESTMWSAYAYNLIIQVGCELAIAYKYRDRIKTWEQAHQVMELFEKVTKFVNEMRLGNELTEPIRKRMTRARESLAKIDEEINQTHKMMDKAVNILGEYGIEYRLIKKEG